MATLDAKARPAVSERLTLRDRMALASERALAAHGAAGGLGGAPATGNMPLSPPQAGPNWDVRAKTGEHVMLMPGQLHFGHEAASVRTLLGSCVAVTLWHPGRRIGGMCHFLLPTRGRQSGEALDGRYGDEALEALVDRLRLAGTAPADYEAHLYGGADTMPESSGVKFNVGERNIEQGWSLIDRYGFQLQGVDVGEDVPRTVTLSWADGRVDMRRGTGKAPPPTFRPAAGGAVGSFSINNANSANSTRRA
jgi:chemotaxis protein CheD